MGITADYWTATGSEVIHEGRSALTREEGDRYVFRTPKLRNVARTAPYFHDCLVETLRNAVQVMAQVQLGRTLVDAELDATQRTGRPVRNPPPEWVGNNS